jgi:hypothetical protein
MHTHPYKNICVRAVLETEQKDWNKLILSFPRLLANIVLGRKRVIKAAKTKY